MMRSLALVLGLLAASPPLAAQAAGASRAARPQARSTARLTVPVAYHKLPNGLRVVLSRDTTVPTAVVAVYYNIGFRNEPRDRTGFAHLFEHLMFQGSQNLGKMEFIKLVQQNGGILNGSTRFDFTNYFQVVPAHTLETVLWAEADRMRGLAIDTANLKNQQEVVKNEVKVNVLNQPYGGFPWIDLPMAANSNWYNAHNFYGELSDLDAATLEDARSFFKTYYAPNNAALVIVGDFEPAQAMAWVNRYFANIPRVTQPPKPDLREPRQTAEKRAGRTDPLATRPALGLAWHLPARNTPEWYAFGLINQILGQGQDSWLYEELVRQKGLTGSVAAGINWGLGNMYDYSGPMLWIVSAYHDTNKPADSLVAAVDRVVTRIQNQPVDRATLDRALVKIRSELYANMESFGGFGKANMLASFALFDDDPARINRLEDGFARVTPAVIQRTAREYLRKTNRTVYVITPGKQQQTPATGGQ
ncbi:MAG TPA: pitrilysin family protein [Gemmatimonadaceae bacterium]|nr:pitrilysin family protein [Gemmatimonadaceae bacterium]